MYRITQLAVAENNARHTAAVNRLYQQLYGESAAVDFSQLSNAIRHSRFWVVLDPAGDVVGMAVLTIVHNLRKEGILENVVIRPDVEDELIHTRLLAHVFADAKTESVTRIRHGNVITPVPKMPPAALLPSLPDAGLTSRPLPVGA